MALPSKKLKICLVSISLAKGGAERSCALLSQMLDSLGHEVFTVVLNDEVDFEYAGKIFNLGKFKSATDSLLNRLNRFRKLRKFLKNEKFDFLIDHRPKSNFGREAYYSRYIYRGFKTIYVIHSSLKSSSLTENPRKMTAIYKGNYATVAVSQYIEKEVLEKIGVKNAITIYNTFNNTSLNENQYLPDSLKDKKYILSYGRLVDEVKDYKFLIDSFEKSELYKNNIYLLIMGEGADADMLKKYASLKKSSQFINFLPFTNQPFSIIKNAHCVTLTSNYEGMPMVLIESLFMGTPVVSLDIISGPNEIIEHEKNGLLVSTRNEALFAAALTKMSLDTVFYKKIKLNTKSSINKYTFNVIAQEWNRLLQNKNDRFN